MLFRSSDENFNLIMKTEMANANVAQNRRDAALDAIRTGQGPSAYYDKERQIFAPESNPMWKFFQTNPDALSGGVKPYNPKQPVGAPPAPAPVPKAPAPKIGIDQNGVYDIGPNGQKVYRK